MQHGEFLKARKELFNYIPQLIQAWAAFNTSISFVFFLGVAGVLFSFIKDAST